MKTINDEREIMMFGETKQSAFDAFYRASELGYTKELYAQSIMSDVQELIARPSTAGLETARQYLNKAKLILSLRN